MSIAEILQNFLAFNQNAFSNLFYTCSQNAWFFILAICAAATIALNCKEALEVSVQEEQDIL